MYCICQDGIGPLYVLLDWQVDQLEPFPHDFKVLKTFRRLAMARDWLDWKENEPS